MPALQIDADALYRAVTAGGHKLLAFHLDLRSGKILSRTLSPDEVAALPDGPSVQPLPKMGGDLALKTGGAPPLAPLSEPAKKKLFADDDAPAKPRFTGDFWLRGDKKKAELFGADGFRRQNATKKLAELFGDAPAPKPPAPDSIPSQTSAPASTSAATAIPGDPMQPRIPIVPEDAQTRWMYAFAHDCGDPEIRDELMPAFKIPKPEAAFEKTLRKYQRMSLQWERSFRKQALDFAEAWLSDLAVQWELVEAEEHR
jgi:hypothetical protein